MGLSTDEYIALTLATPAPLPVAPKYLVLEGEEWQQHFDEWMREVAARAHLYPPGFELDVSREAMYPDSEDGR